MVGAHGQLNVMVRFRYLRGSVSRLPRPEVLLRRFCGMERLLEVGVVLVVSGGNQ